LTPPSLDVTTTCAGPCSKVTYTLPSRPTTGCDPCRPFLRVFAAGETWLGGPNETPPSVEYDTSTGSDVLCRKDVQDTYTRPKNGLELLLSTATHSLSLKSTGLSLVVAMLGPLHVRPLSSDQLTAMYSGAFLGGNGLRPDL